MATNPAQSDRPHSLPLDWQPTAGWPPVAPDRNRCLVKKQARVLCGPCKRELGGRVTAHLTATNNPCDKCGVGTQGGVGGEQLALL